MKLDLSRSDYTLPLLESLRILEPLWVLAAMLLFLAGPKRGVWIAVGLALLALSFLQRWIVMGHLSRPTVFAVSWMLLLAGAIVSLWASYDVSLSLPVLLTLIGSIALYYVVVNAPRPRMLAQAALLAGLAVAVYFLTQYQYIPHAGKSSLASSLGRVTSGLFPRLGSWEPFSNGVATLLEGLIPLGVALTLIGRSRGWRMISGAATGVMGLAVLVAASRGAWVALLAAGVLWLTSRWRRGVIVLGGAILVALAAMGGYLTLVEGATLAGIPILGPVLYQFFARPDRLEVYQGSLRLIQDFPLTGIGLGEVFALVYSKYVLLIPHAFLTYSHNLYLTVWLGHGLLGIIGMGWLVVAFGYLVVREGREGRSSSLFQAAGTGVVVILVHGLFDARQYVDLWTMWPLFVLLGLVVSTSTVMVREASVKTRRARSRLWEWVALGLLVVGCAVVWRPLLAVTCANLGAVKQAKAELVNLPGDVKDARLRAAIANYECALQLVPNNRTAKLRLGNLVVADGWYEEGIAHLEIVWQAAPEDRTACKALGLAYAWVGEIDRAVELLKYTKDIVAELNTWGGWHSQEGRQQVAMNAYRTSLALKPDQPQVRDRLTTLEGK
jgi:O-antigen ligase